MTKKKTEETKPDDGLELALRRFVDAVEADQDEADLAQFDLKFHAGSQWPEDIEQKRKRKNRPCLTINLLPEKTDQVIGDMRQNKPQLKFKPVDDVADPDTAEVLTGLARQIFNNSDMDLITDHASESQIICGRGVFRGLTRYVDDDSFDQELAFRWIPNAFSVKWDPNAQEYDKQDARYMFIAEDMTLEAFKAEFPDHASDSTWPDSSSQNYDIVQHWRTNDKITVAEYFEKRFVEKTLVQLSSGQVVEKSAAPDGAVVVNERRVNVGEIWWSKMTGSGYIEKPRQIDGKYFPIFFVWGKESNLAGKRTVRGMVRHAIDAQRMFNYWETKATETVALSPTAPFLMTNKQLGDPKNKKQYDAAAEGELVSVLTFEPDDRAPGIPQRIQPPVVPTGIERRSEVNRELVKATTGIYDTSVGAPSNETSGISITKRDQRAARGWFAYSDNMKRTLRTVGKWILDMIPHTYDTERIVRILGPDGEQANVRFGRVPENYDPQSVPPEERIFDPSVGKYDVVVDVGPNYANARDEMAEGMAFLMQTAPDVTPVLLPRLAKALSWPDADKIAEDLEYMLPPALILKHFREKGQQLPPELEAMLSAGAEGEQPASPQATPGEGAKQAVEVVKALAEARKSGIPLELVDQVGQMLSQQNQPTGG